MAFGGKHPNNVDFFIDDDDDDNRWKQDNEFNHQEAEKKPPETFDG